MKLKTTIGHAALVAAVAMFAANASETLIWDDRPASADRTGSKADDKSDEWECSWYPLGNGRLGCMVDGDPWRLCIQFNVDSLWTGDENVSTDAGDATRGARVQLRLQVRRLDRSV